MAKKVHKAITHAEFILTTNHRVSNEEMDKFIVEAEIKVNEMGGFNTMIVDPIEKNVAREYKVGIRLHVKKKARSF